MLRRTVLENERAAGIVRTLRDLFKGRHTATEPRRLDVIIEAIVRLMQQRATEAGATITVHALNASIP
jgi:C4-dicarboxylate-specific signal transduction histidine kinase